MRNKRCLKVLSDEQLGYIKDKLNQGGVEEMNVSIDTMVECALENPDDFLKVRETLTRIG